MTMLMMAYMSLMVDTRSASWLQVHKTLADFKSVAEMQTRMHRRQQMRMRWENLHNR